LGLDDLEMGSDERIFSSIRNLYAGLLLLFKEKLLRLSPENSGEVLIKAEIMPILHNGRILFAAGRSKKTVDLHQIENRFKNLGVKVDWGRVNAVQQKRNDIEHYYTLDKKDAIREVVSDIFIVIRDFIKDELNDDPKELLGNKHWNIMLNTSKLFESQRKTCLDSLKNVNWPSDLISNYVEQIRCSSCGSFLLAPSNHTVQVKIEDQYFDCESCGQAVQYSDLLESFLNNHSSEEPNPQSLSANE
jgi:hypothetical protein